MRGKKKKTSYRWVGPLVLIAFFVIWEIGCRVNQTPTYVLPSPSGIFRTLVREWPTLMAHSWVTLKETLIGLALAILLGMGLALLSDLSPVLHHALQPLMIITQTVPIIALAPILMIHLGFGLAPKVLCVVLMCFYPITISFREGLEEVPEGYVRLLKTMGAGKGALYRYVKIPSAFVSLFAGLKVSSTYALGGALVGEWLSSQEGLGYYLVRKMSAFSLEPVFAAIVMVILWSMLLNALASLVQFLFTPGKGYFMRQSRTKKKANLKKALSGLLALALLLTATACGKGDDQASDSAQSTEASESQAPASENASSEETASGKLRPVTVILDYTINTNHSGLYTALDKGYYKDQGLDVKIVEPAGGVTLQLLAAGQGDFGVSYQEDLTYAKTQAEPLPVKAIATVIQHNTSGFASLKDKKIESPKDFEGKTYAGWGADSEAAVIKAVMKKYGADPEKINIISSENTSYSNLATDVDFMWFFEGWDMVAAKQQGLELNYLPLNKLDERLDYYTPILVAKEDTLDKDPELVSKFLAATSKGYDYCSDPKNAQEVVDILMKYAPESDPKLLLESQQFLAGQYSKDAKQWGLMKDSVWDQYTAFMKENGLIDKDLPAADQATNDFLPGQAKGLKAE